MDHSPLVRFGDDGTPSSDLAWLWINSHHWTGWSLVRCTATAVVFPATNPMREVRVIDRAPFAEAGFAHHESVVIDGDARVALANASPKADVMVVGVRHVRSDIRSAWSGSTSWWLMERPPAPLLIARHGRTTRTALATSDGSVHSTAAMEALARMPWATDVAATVLVVDDGHTNVDQGVANAERALTGKVGSVTIDIRKGRPAVVAVDAAQDSGADVVVLGTRGLTGFTRLRVGSTAGAIAQRTAATILMAHHEPDAPDHG